MRVDPGDPSHVRPLLEWLRAWRCRQFVLRDEALSVDGLSCWWREWGERLPQPERSLDQLTDAEIETICAAYEALRDTQASWQQVDGRPFAKSFGPAGSAKALYAIRPNACSPWDDPIREHFGLSESGEDYRRHLDRIKRELSEVVNDLEPGMGATALPELLGRLDSSPVKLVDEHDWVRYSQGFEPPPHEILAMWARWASLEAG